MELKEIGSLFLALRNIFFAVSFILSSAVCSQVSTPGVHLDREEITVTVLDQAQDHIKAYIEAESGIFNAMAYYAINPNGPFQEMLISHAQPHIYILKTPRETGMKALYFYIKVISNEGNMITQQLLAPAGNDAHSEHHGKKSVVARVTSEFGKLNVFPNPAVEYVWIAYSPSSFDNEYHDLTLRIYGPNGKTCIEKQLSTDETQFRINVGQLASGTYYIILHDEWGRFMSDKLVVK